MEGEDKSTNNSCWYIYLGFSKASDKQKDKQKNISFLTLTVPEHERVQATNLLIIIFINQHN